MQKFKFQKFENFHNSVINSLSHTYRDEPQHIPTQYHQYYITQNIENKENQYNYFLIDQSHKIITPGQRTPHSHHLGQFINNTNTNKSTIINDNLYVSKGLYSILHDIVLKFLPHGYPNSVREGYIYFATGQMISSILGTVTVCGVLSMQSLFHAVGIGFMLTTPLAAALNWIIKDGLGQVTN